MTAARAPSAHCRRRPSSGVSLTEIVVAVIFLSLALMPILSLLIAGHQGTAATLHQTQAFLLADDVVEAVGALSYDEIDQNLPADIAANMPVSGIYNRTVEVDPKEDVTPTADKKGTFHVRVVTVKVTWDTPSERPQSADKMQHNLIQLVALATKVDR